MIETVDGLRLHYRVSGQGTPMLMVAPGGFDSTIDRWAIAGVWKAMRPLDTLAGELELIAYDRRECGDSGGRVEVLSWKVYADQAIGLLRHLGRKPAIVLGACMGCSIAIAIAAHHPEWCSKLILHWPVGGYRWRQTGLERFDAHLRYLEHHTLHEVAGRAREGASFWQDPEGGPWIGEVARDPAFRQRFVEIDPAHYRAIVTRSRDELFVDEFPTGARAVEVAGIAQPALIVPGGDDVHTRSAAYALHELLRASQLWDVPVSGQTPDDVRSRLMQFALGTVTP
jgi:pimeloyl-ACP methyl ester carboxylesterase